LIPNANPKTINKSTKKQKEAIRKDFFKKLPSFFIAPHLYALDDSTLSTSLET
jgi:hypothetical protein